MGGGSWSSSSWKGYASTSGLHSKTTKGIYSSSSMDQDLDPKGAKIRESRDSKDNPLSTPVIIALDVTGSMSRVLDAIARTGLNTLCTEIYDRKPITGPHVMCMGIGDVAAGDRAPLQVTQFEADIRIAKQLEKIYLEGGGGGNDYESYALAWYFAARHTVTDSFEKRAKKGYLFTVGDEEPTPQLTADEIEAVMGTPCQEKVIKMNDLLTEVSKKWEIFHCVIEEGSYASSRPDLKSNWQKLLGQRVLMVPDHTKLAEVIVSTIQMCEGVDKKTVVDSWDGSTAIAVKAATKDLDVAKLKGGVATL